MSSRAARVVTQKRRKKKKKPVQKRQKRGERVCARGVVVVMIDCICFFLKQIQMATKDMKKGSTSVIISEGKKQ